MKNLLKTAVVALALSCFQAYGMKPGSELAKRFNIYSDDYYRCEEGTDFIEAIPDVMDRFNGPYPYRMINELDLIYEYDRCCSEISFFQSLFGKGCDEICSMEKLLGKNEYIIWAEDYRSFRNRFMGGGTYGVSYDEIHIAFFSEGRIKIITMVCD